MTQTSQRIRRKRRYHNGKRVSKGEKRIAEILDSKNIKYIQEQQFSGCIGLKGGLLRFDFYLPEINLCIEYQGEHHYSPVNKGFNAKKVHYQTLHHDRIKREYMSTYSTKLVIIPYTHFDQLEEILTSILLDN